MSFPNISVFLPSSLFPSFLFTMRFSFLWSFVFSAIVFQSKVTIALPIPYRAKLTVNIASETVPEFVKGAIPDLENLAISLSTSVDKFLYRDSGHGHLFHPHHLHHLTYSKLRISFTEKNGVGVTFRNKEKAEYEIVVSNGHLMRCRERLREELAGILVHEMVHVYQNDRNAPGGLIEGIADYVRAELGYAMYDVRFDGSKRWDSGYKHTAGFLRYLDENRKKGAVRLINNAAAMGYSEQLWNDIFGSSVETLYREFVKSS